MRHPILFMTGALAAGVGISRLLRRAPAASQTQEGFDAADPAFLAGYEPGGPTSQTAPSSPSSMPTVG